MQILRAMLSKNSFFIKQIKKCINIFKAAKEKRAKEFPNVGECDQGQRQADNGVDDEKRSSVPGERRDEAETCFWNNLIGQTKYPRKRNEPTGMIVVVAKRMAIGIVHMSSMCRHTLD